MAQRGRKSAAALAVVTSLPGQRPEPPAELTQEQADEWRAVVATKPADWFGRDNQAMLVDYCRHIVLARRIAEALNSLDKPDLTSKEGLQRLAALDKLGAMLERHTRTIASLATRMRLTQQSRYNAQSANTASAKGDGATGARRPWEFGAAS